MSSRKKLASALCAGLAVAGLAIAGTGSQAGAAQRPTVATVAGSVAPFISRTPSLGDLPAGQRLTIELWLQPRTAAATSFAEAVSTPGSPEFHRYLTPDAYAARFAATAADAGAVESWLRAGGFTAVSADPERAYVRASGTAATIGKAFDVQLKRYQATAAVNAGGQPLWSNDRPVSLPAALSRVVLGITGLDNAAPTDSTPASQATTTTATCSSFYGQRLQAELPSHFGRTSFPTQICGYSARQLRAAYGASTANTGKGQTIAFVELGSPEPDMLPTLQDYARVSGLSVPSAKQFAQVTAGKGCSEADPADGRATAAAAPDVDVEEQMDLEAAYAMAPGVREVVVSGLSCAGSDPETQGLLNAVSKVLGGSGRRPLASIVSNSWDSGPETQPASTTKVEHADLVRAAAEGVGMYVAAGDASGLDAPAGDPFATAVGGTTLGIGETGNRLFETGWSTGWLMLQNGKWLSEGAYSASGGGPSALWKQPAYQKGVVPAALSRSPGHSGLYRSVPDLSASADPATAMAVGLLTIAKNKKPVFSMVPGGGTSEATPLVAGMVAAAQQGMKKPFGFLNPVLYTLAGTRAFRDVLPLTAATPSLYRGVTCNVAACGVRELRLFDVQSDNKAAGYSGQVTLKGYDTMTGLGTPDGQSFISALRATEK
ncbi:MAG TPA: S53 family peptidase [Trebonia sp.]|nr:S53 family peptidase [Trebonia sp.]